MRRIAVDGGDNGSKRVGRCAAGPPGMVGQGTTDEPAAGEPSQPFILPDDWLGVFELNEETAEPEPEHGDFWGVVDEEELI